MPKKKKELISKRNSDIPTEYYFTGKTTFIRNVGEIPSKIQKLDDDGKVDSTYLLSVVTTYFIYYLDQVCDSEDTLMIPRKMKLVSDIFLAYNSLSELVGKMFQYCGCPKQLRFGKEKNISNHICLLPTS